MERSMAALKTSNHWSRSVLVINPNTTQAMTDALRPLVDHLGYKETRYEYFTAPAGAASINNEADAAISAEACLKAFDDRISWFQAFDGYLVCCYSKHPLVELIRGRIASDKSHNRRRIVTGIFEASVAVCLQSLNPTPKVSTTKFGIVSTGKQWEETLGDAVADLLGSSHSLRYAGTETTGLNADELHRTPELEVAKRMRAATHRLLSNGARAICLGCAGMAGLNAMVREECVDTLGATEGNAVVIVDGVIAGVIYLEGAIRAGL